MDTAQPSPQPRTAARPHVRIVAALATALVALVAVVIVLVAFGRETRALRMELVDLVEPAHAGLLDLQRILALQMAAQRGYRLAGDAAAAERYRELLEEEAEVYRRLTPLAHALGPEASATLTELRGAAARWHEAVERSGLAGGADALAVPLSTREGYFAAALGEADRLGSIIDAAAERRREAIAARQRFEDGLIVGMVLLATLAVGVLARLGQRLHVVSLEARRMAAMAESRREALLRAAEEKESFIRGITHDLKNPLGVIDGSAELLEVGARGAISANQRDLLARIRGAAAEMLGIINDLLELSRAQAAALRIRRADVDVNALVGETVERYRPTLEARGLDLRFEPLPAPLTIATDAARVREILGNLLTNAVRHTPRGGAVRVAIRQAENTGGSGGVAITVTDDGPGVPPEMRDRIFLEFHRGGDSPGSGVGLAIGRKLARALGGDLVLADPPPGGGATFRLTLPIAGLEPAVIPAGPEASAARRGP